MQKISFRKKLIIGNIISFILVLLGMAAIGLTLYTVGNGIKVDDFAKGFYRGTGGGLIGAGTITIIINLYTMNNDKKFKEAEIKYRDERNKIILQKTAAVSFFICLFASYVGILILGLINEYIFNTLLVVFGIQGIILFVVYIVMNKII